MNIIISVVIYNHTYKDLELLLNSLKNISAQIYFLDNSEKPNNEVIEQIKVRSYLYIKSKTNKGFGAGHNQIIFKYASISDNPILVFLNPDVSFDYKLFNRLLDFYSQKKAEISGMNPRILNQNFSDQENPKIIPNFFHLILRKVLRQSWYQNRFLKKYMLKNEDLSQIIEVEILSGSCLITTYAYFNMANGFDQKYFLYFEDWDLSKKLSAFGKLVHYGEVPIIHEKQSAANNNLIHLKYYSKSMLRFYIKNMKLNK